MTEKPPNDIFQYSTTGALQAGHSDGGPVVNQLGNYGSHGIGTFSQSTDELLLLDSQAYRITGNNEDGEVKCLSKAAQDASLAFVMVTKFVPEYQLPVSGQLEKDALLDIFKYHGPEAGGQNSFIPFKIWGKFSKVKLKHTGRRRSDPAFSPSLVETASLSHTQGTVFGFIGPQWAEGMSVTGVCCYFLSVSDGDKRVFGGTVEEFQAQGEVELSWAVTGRFHIGFPRGEKWENTQIGG